jgi:hypothetical protein
VNRWPTNCGKPDEKVINHYEILKIISIIT